jgi:hypothetical protein
LGLSLEEKGPRENQERRQSNAKERRQTTSRNTNTGRTIIILAL